MQKSEPKKFGLLLLNVLMFSRLAESRSKINSAQEQKDKLRQIKNDLKNL